MYHSIQINGKDCLQNWHLLPNGRLHVPPPSIREKIVELPSGNGDIDLTESLTGYPLYGNREGSFDFLVMHDYADYDQATLYNQILKDLHGKVCKVELVDDDPYYYYYGRIKVDDWSEERPFNTVSLSYSFEPYKWRNEKASSQFSTTSHHWTINVYQGEGGEPSDDGYYIAKGSQFWNDWTSCLEDAPITPYIKVENLDTDLEGTAIAQLEFYNQELGLDVELTLPSGTHRSPLITLSNFSGINSMWFKCNSFCKLTIDWRNGKI